MHIPNAKKNRIVMIDCSSKCDLACSGCTRALAQHRKPDMTVEQFTQAVKASRDWIIREKGVLGLFGGNVCVSKLFPDYARILAEHLPEECRGLWSNRIFSHGKVIREFFGPRSYYNFVCHGEKEAAEEILREIPWITPGPNKQNPSARVFGADKHSIHASIFVAAGDFVKTDKELWDLVDKCAYDINWSPIIMQEPGDNWSQIAGYSCEIAGTHARVNGKSLGVPIVPGWLDLSLEHFRKQYEFACPRCGGCLGLEGIDDVAETDQYSQANANIVPMTISRKRKLELVTSIPGRQVNPTNYLRI